ncbi:putative membrane protein [Wickerhamomyces ciferrii]|uniref:Membrane protein n=1 Tax=Wickerhamomyces ciferrii (strain ATCC 14091 / BCRC 22168 / CBS 111 / JCM 3599 / NBRC 0793 / NRRL Y-1031 F-60-10) TaxID=1206466 RepID=K0KJ43_WICCF|nr:uncharacterized protein BN7_2532 [Wickerhamomyces ciferrii]CCH42986.1 putative membrane protein [Wickerhamomyces ciferrii]
MSQDVLKESDVSSPLYDIYNKNDIDQDNNDNEIYDSLNSNIAKNQSKLQNEISHNKPNHLSFTKIIISLFILSISGILYNQLGQHIHDNHILVPELASKPLEIGIKIGNALVFHDSVPKWVIYSIEGIIFGLIQPLIDYIFNLKSGKIQTKIDSNSIIRASVAFLGVSFAVRKIEWNSSIQASIAWSLLSPCLWLLLDGTLSGFLTSVTIASIASFSVVVLEGLPKNWNQDYEFSAIMLWLGNFFFFGLIIFGKIGRYLFQ